MKLFLTLAFVWLLSLFIFAQCPTQYFEIQTQGAIDSFSINYPGCTNANILHIHGSNITNLEGLSALTTFNTLAISQTQIEDLHGLENLQSVRSLDIASNPKLKDLSALQALTSIKRFVFWKNTIFDNTFPFQNIKNMASIEAKFNPALTHLDGFENLETINSLDISDNTRLVSTKGFGKLKGIYDLRISRLPAISKVEGFDQLHELKQFSCSYNNRLEDISFLTQIDPTLVQSLTITNNPKLTTCHFICNLIHVPNQYKLIHDNGTGCSSIPALGCENSFYGTIFYDENQNQIQDADEHGIPYLFAYENDHGFWTLTNRQGEFGFKGIHGKEYLIKPQIDFDEWELTTNQTSYQFVYDSTRHQSAVFGLVPRKKEHDVDGFLQVYPNQFITMTITNNGPFRETGKMTLEYDTALQISQYTPPSYVDTSRHEATWIVDDIPPYGFKRFYLLFNYTTSSSQKYKLTAKSYLDTKSGSQLVSTNEFYDYFPYDFFSSKTCHINAYPSGTGSNHTITTDDHLTYILSFKGDSKIITNPLPSQLNPATFKLLYTYNIPEVKLDNGIFKCTFDDSYPYDTHPQLIYKIDLLDNLTVPTTIQNHFSSQGYFTCQSDTVTRTLVSPLRAWQITDDDLLIGPNPTSDFFRIQYSTAYEQKGRKLLIYNSLGQLVRTYTVTSNKRYYVQGLASGFYTVVLRTEDAKQKNHTGKLFIP